MLRNEVLNIGIVWLNRYFYGNISCLEYFKNSIVTHSKKKVIKTCIKKNPHTAKKHNYFFRFFIIKLSFGFFRNFGHLARPFFVLFCIIFHHRYLHGFFVVRSITLRSSKIIYIRKFFLEFFKKWLKNEFCVFRQNLLCLNPHLLLD